MSALSDVAKENGVKFVACPLCHQEKRASYISPNCHCKLCPDCKNVPMESKGATDYECDGGGRTLYQCPACKNVELA
jgi:uncharacterized C2H2 Zn-finger protein